jgi:molybdate transport system permease protein
MATLLTRPRLPSPGNLGAGALALYLGFMGVILAALVGYASPANLLSSLVSPEVGFAAGLSLLTATGSTLLSLLLAVPAGYLLGHRRLPAILDTLLDLPLVLPPIAVGITLLVFFQTGAGDFVQQHITRFVFAQWGIVLAQFTLTSGFALRLVKTTFDGVDRRYETTARTLGAGPWQAFRHVTLPLARNGIMAAAVLTWARAVGDFGATVTLVGATAFKTETLPIAIFLNLSTANVDGAIAVTVILLALSFLTLFAFRWIAREEVHA